MKFLLKTAALACLLACGISGSAQAATINGYSTGKTGLAFSNPFTVCGDSNYQASFKNFSYSSPALKSFSFGSRVSPLWAPGGFSFDCSGFTAPTSTGGTFALCGLGVGKAFKKPTTPVVEPSKQTPPDPDTQVGPQDAGSSEKVPDGGSTLLMLGASLLGLHGFVKLLKPRN
jgi:hypothetical protein